MTVSVATILRQAADLITPPGTWTQHYMAKSAKGNSVRAGSRSAVCWCAMGAIKRAGNGSDYEGWSALRDHLQCAVVAFNDARGRTQAEVVAALRAAADKAEASV
jgi:hypothetical protein